jgi:hypothetical protein
MTAIVTGPAVRDDHVVVPDAEERTGRETARLCFDTGLENLRLRAAPGEYLVDARFEGPIPTVWADGRNVHVEYPFGSRLSRRPGTSTVQLDSAVPWAVDIHGGAHRLDARLDAADVRAVTFHAGVAHVGLVLGRPVASTTIRFTSVKDVHLERPAEVPVLLEIAGGARDVRLDDRWHGAVGHGLVEGTGRVQRGGHPYHVIVSGSADTITIAGVAA